VTLTAGIGKARCTASCQRSKKKTSADRRCKATTGSHQGFHTPSLEEFSMRTVLFGLLIVLLALTSHAANAAPQTAQSAVASRSAEYVDISEYLTSDADINAWYTATSQLRKNFDDVCGDTFCEGDYSNIESLDYRCSVEKNTGVIGRCVWVFAASNTEVNAKTGNILVDNQHWRCRSPLAPKTRIADLIATLNVTNPIHAILPGTSKSIYDELVDCL
jgi:hypothetical protein